MFVSLGLVFGWPLTTNSPLRFNGLPSFVSARRLLAGSLAAEVPCSQIGNFRWLILVVASTLSLGRVLLLAKTRLGWTSITFTWVPSSIRFAVIASNRRSFNPLSWKRSRRSFNGVPRLQRPTDYSPIFPKLT